MKNLPEKVEKNTSKPFPDNKTWRFCDKKSRFEPKSRIIFVTRDEIFKKKCNFAEKLVTMPLKDLKEKLQELTRKVETLRKRYFALQAEKKELERTVERQELEIAKLEKDLAQMKIDNEFLRVAHSVPSDPAAIAQYKKQVAKMVRDIDRCIKQLNA